MPHCISRIAILLLVVVTTACAQTRVATREGEGRPPIAGARVLLIPADIELYEVTVGGLLEPKAEWTTSARTHVAAALNEALARKNAVLLHYQRPRNDPSKEAAQIQLIKLHDVVGGAILTHHFGLGPSLPTKEGKFDWSLGQGARLLRENFNADYALFVLIRDSYASGGRMAAAAVMSVLSLAPVSPGGQQVGFASLVDLRTGDIVWFNWMARGTGDLRQTDPARDAVAALLTDFPR
jgi:hypothetical protein